MIKRRAVLGLSLLTALLSCTFMAEGASAAQAVDTTTYTCFDTGDFETGDFTDGHCDTLGKPGKAKYKHEPFGGPFSKTELTTTNCGVTDSTKKCEPTVVKGKAKYKHEPFGGPFSKTELTKTNC